MLFKSKKKEFSPGEHLRVQKVKCLYQGKVVKEYNQLQYRSHDWDGDYWYTLPTDDYVREIDEKQLKEMGLEVPSE